jgi:hypothetical protein
MTVAVQVAAARQAAMTRTFLAALTALALVAPLTAQAQIENFDLSKPGLDSQARCAALFAIVANEQRRDAPGASRFPTMADAGREFFVQTGMRLKAERNFDETGVTAFFKELVGKIQKEYAEAPDAGTKLDAEMKACLEMKQVVIPAKPAG